MNPRDVLNKWLAKKGSRIERSMPIVFRENVEFRADFDFIFQSVIYRNGGKFCFAQIGANDGISRSDDIANYIKHFDATGIMVEPQPELFKQLSNNFSDYPAVKTINKAIHKNEKVMVLYRLEQELLRDKSDLPLWATTNGIASFDKNHVLEHAQRIGFGEEVITKHNVECMALDELLSQNECEKLDLLKVDTEGYDYEVLSMLDLEKIKPTIIRFEHLHMSTAEYEKLIYQFIDVGYSFIADKMNTTAYRHIAPF